MKRLLSSNFDLTGSETLRVGRTFVMSKLIPLGNFGGGPNIRCLLVLMVLHYFSKPVFWLLVREEHFVYRILRKIKRFLK